MSRAPTLRKLLAVEPLYRDEIFLCMGGETRHVQAAITELAKAGDLRIPPASVITRYRLTPKGQAAAFGGAHA